MARRSSTQSKAPARRGTGRPTSLTQNTHDTIVGYAEEGLPLETCATLAGIHPATFFRWMNRGEQARITLDENGSIPDEEEPFREFREAVLNARALAMRKMTRLVTKAATGGHVLSETYLQDMNGDLVYDNEGNPAVNRVYAPIDGRLAMKFLERAQPKEWSPAAATIQAKVEVSGPDGGPVHVKHSLEEIGNLHDRLARVKAEREEDERVMAAVEAGQDPEDIVDAELVDEG